jgi:hypothetical protein
MKSLRIVELCLRFLIYLLGVLNYLGRRVTTCLTFLHKGNKKFWEELGRTYCPFTVILVFDTSRKKILVYVLNEVN